MSFQRTTRDPSTPLRLAVVGAGGMGRAWLGQIARNPDTVLAGIVDLDLGAARKAATGAGLDETRAAVSLTELGDRTELDAVLDVTVPAAHHAVTLEAFRLGLPVLGEKPLAATLAEAADLVRAADEAGLLFMVSQNRRYLPGLWHLKHTTELLGGAGILSQEFFKGPRFGGFRDAMDHPLLLDMAIHNFDAARFLLDADAVAVYCEEYNPDWSWYAGNAATTAIFEMSGGQRFVYTGSWCSPGLETEWIGSWRVSAPFGSARWADGSPTAELEFTGEGGVPDTGPVPVPPGSDLAGSLTEFVRALRTGETPMTAAADNIKSLAMVHAAIRSAQTGRRVRVAEVLAEAAAPGAAAGQPAKGSTGSPVTPA